MSKRLIVIKSILVFICWFFCCASNLCAEETDFRGVLISKTYSERIAILNDTIKNSNDNINILSASKYYLDLAQDENDELRISDAYLQIGRAFWQLSEYPKAIDYLFKAIEVGTTARDTLTMIEANIYIGLIYNSNTDWENSKRHFVEALRISNEAKRIYELASCSWNLTFVYLSTEKFDSAYYYSNMSLNYLSQMPDQTSYKTLFGYGLAYLYRSMICHDQKNYDSSLAHVRKAVEICRTIKCDNILAPALNELCLNFLSTGNLDSILVYGKEAVLLSEKLNNFYYLVDINNYLSKAYESINQKDSAFAYYKKFKIATDSLNKYDARAASAKHELENFKKENEIQDIKKTNVLYLTLVVIIGLIGISVLLYSRYRLKNRTNKQLAELNSTKDRLFSIISHDLRTPVNSFNDLITLLNQYYDDFSKDEIKTHIGTIKKSSDNILMLLENLLLWAKVQLKGVEPIPEYISFTEIVNTEIGNLKPFSDKKNISFQTEIDSTNEIYADKEMLSVVIRNLLSNSIKFSHENGLVKIIGERSNKHYELSIEDTGIGIKDEDKGKLFTLDTKFSTLGTSNEKGTGLGLCLCKEYIEKNRGKISFESVYNVGSKFFITMNISN